MSGHRGTGVIVRNESKSRFLVQEKDADYVPCPGCFSFFGGAIEAGETPDEALWRELAEELDPTAVQLLGRSARQVFQGTIPAGGDSNFEFTLFEIVVQDRVLDSLASRPVREGLAARVLSRQSLEEVHLVWNLSTARDAYLAWLDDA